MYLSARFLRVAIFLSFLLISVLVCLPIILVSLNSMQEALVREKINHLRSLASSRTHQIERLLDYWVEQINLVSSRTQLRLSMQSFAKDKKVRHFKKMNRSLADAKASTPKMVHISLIDLSGKIIASTDSDKIGLNISKHEEFVLGRSKGKVHSNRLANTLPLVSVTSPMLLEGKVIGIAWSEMVIADLNIIALDDTGLGETGELLIAGKTKDHSSIMLAPSRADNSIAFNPIFAQKYPALMNRIMSARNKSLSVISFDDYRGVPVIAVSQPILNMNWGLMAKMDLSEIEQPILQTRNQILIIVIMLSIPVLILSGWISNKLTRAVRSAEAETKSIVEAAGDAIILIDQEGCIVGVNSAGEKLFGYSENEIIGQPAGILSNPKFFDKYNKLVQYLCRRNLSRPIEHVELIGQTSADMDIPVEVSISQSTAQGATHLIIICRDIVKRKETEKQQRKLADAQRQFVEIASHEFRTPVSIISNSVQHLERRSADIDKEYLLSKSGKIRVALSRMMLLMKSALSLSGIEQGKFFPEIESCKIAEIVADVCSQHQDLSKKHLISCSFQDLPECIEADPVAVEQILSSLIDNAIKYSPDTEEIRIEAVGKGAFVSISVSDQGVGIDQGDFSKLFERFYRAKTSVGVSGAGVGLYLAKTFAEMHGGTIEVVSEKGVGSTFTLTLPVSGPKSGELRSDCAA